MSSSAASSANIEPQFTYLMELSDDLILTILSFVADVPLEEQDYETTAGVSDLYSTTTHILPYVNKHFYNLLKGDNGEGGGGGGQDVFYKSGLIRLCKNDPRLWKTALQKLLPPPPSAASRGEGRKKKKNNEKQKKEEHRNGDNSVASNNDDSLVTDSTATNTGDQAETTEELLEQLIQTTSSPLITMPKLYYTNYLDLYKTILDTQLRFRGPIFYMPDTVMLNRPIGLHFFEQRYRVLIHSVMEPYPNEARRGQPLKEVLKAMPQGSNKLNEYPKFIYAHASPLQKGSPAVIVEVHQCLIHPNGTADVHLLPVQFVWLEQIWELPNAGALYFAQARKMNTESSSQMEGRPPFMTFH